MDRRAASEWLSCHIFYQGPGDRVLSELVLPFVSSSWRHRRVASFFFLRYGLGGPHVRLRLLCTPGSKAETGESLQQAATDFFRSWPSETRLTDEEIRRENRHFPADDGTCPIDAVFPNNSLLEMPFQPEVERYGGPDLIASSLDFFCISSCYALRALEELAGEPRSRRLSRAMRALLRQALGFTAGGGRLASLVAYAAQGTDPGSSLLITRADQEFDRCRDDYVALVREEVELAQDPAARARLADHQLTAAAGSLAERIRDASVPVWRRIVSSQLHMTANRMGLMNLEEIYLGHILRRAVEDAGLASPPGRRAPERGDRLAGLAAASLEQLTSSARGGDPVSPVALQEVSDGR